LPEQRLYTILRFMRILLIEDDAAIMRVLQRGLSSQGHQPVTAITGEEGLQHLVADKTIDLLLLDLTLPGLNGQQVLAQLRQQRPRLPVIMLTARDDLTSKVSLLQAGADDYLTKPFAFEELLARIQALMRRVEPPDAAQILAGTLRLDLQAQRVWRGTHLLDLTKREFALLAYLMRHPRQVLSRILLALWRDDFDPESNVVEVYIRNLRTKIDERNQPSLIVTVRGSGYRFEPPS
jgi:DNA-binding response OmpR family regulator